MKSKILGHLNRKNFNQIKTSFIFIGYPRSGHSLVGSIIDASEQAVCSHEVDILYYVESGYQRNQLFCLLIEGSKRFRKKGNHHTGHNYKFPSGFQGKTTQPLVIGDKKGGRSTRRLMKDPSLLQKYSTISGHQTQLIHVYRHPLDNLESRIKYRTKVNSKSFAHNEAFFLKKMDQLYQCVGEISNTWPCHHLALEDLVNDPRRTVNRLYEYLGLGLNDQLIGEIENRLDPCYLGAWRAKQWNPKTIDAFHNWVERYPFLNRYSIE